MSESDDGGLAFGSVISIDCVRLDMDGTAEYEPRVESGNLTVRDYFAAQALNGMVAARLPGSHLVPPNAAQLAYEYADEMLRARSR